MSAFLSIRNDPHFRRYFDAVHPFFWPVLYWQLKAAWLFLQREKLTSILLAVSWWGGVRIVFLGDRIEAPVANPFALTKPRWDDPVWSSDVPFDIETRALREAIAGALLLPRKAGEGRARDRRKPAAPLASMLDST
ncbi:hypothetical protein [Hyphomonas sp.]|uniref:hypothetical protein n=1 Tax=Hyphomonas sp. TaxID=87 RepID=UPI00391D0A6A